jgi:hypothetical protein
VPAIRLVAMVFARCTSRNDRCRPPSLHRHSDLHWRH